MPDYNPRFYPKDKTASKPQAGEQRYYVALTGPPIPVLMLDDMGLGEWDLGHCKERRRQWSDRLLTADEVTEWLTNYLAHAEFRLAEETMEWTSRRAMVKATLERWPHVYTVDVILHGAQPYPCVVCGQLRQAAVHT